MNEEDLEMAASKAKLMIADESLQKSSLMSATTVLELLTSGDSRGTPEAHAGLRDLTPTLECSPEAETESFPLATAE